MAKDVIVRCENLTKTYDLYTGEGARILALLGLPAKGMHYSALDGVTQDFLRGEIVGLAGLNGSGKSTLAKIIAGITHPTSGSCRVRGTVNMLAANVGMNEQLTGRENIHYKCMLMGLTKKQIARVEDSIIDFAEVGVYIDQPLRTYSSGMRSRLGFAISVHVDPEILIVDEALSVGDAAFSEKCLSRMQEFRDSGKTIFFVTHAPWQMLHFCDRVMWLHKGRVVGFDEADVMVPSYVEFTRDWTKMEQAEREAMEPSYQQYREKFQNQQREAWARKAAERANSPQ